MRSPVAKSRRQQSPLQEQVEARPRDDRAPRPDRYYSCSPCCFMQDRYFCIWWSPQVCWLIFPASAVQSRSDFSRALLIPPSFASLREARHGERGNRKPQGKNCGYWFVHTNLASISLQTSPRAWVSDGLENHQPHALHCCKPASRVLRERLQNCHPRVEPVKRLMRNPVTAPLRLMALHHTLRR
jgi:hypothetical protein